MVLMRKSSVLCNVLYKERVRFSFASTRTPWYTTSDEQKEQSVLKTSYLGLN